MCQLGCPQQKGNHVITMPHPPSWHCAMTDSQEDANGETRKYMKSGKEWEGHRFTTNWFDTLTTRQFLSQDLRVEPNYYFPNCLP